MCNIIFFNQKGHVLWWHSLSICYFSIVQKNWKEKRVDYLQMKKAARNSFNLQKTPLRSNLHRLWNHQWCIFLYCTDSEITGEPITNSHTLSGQNSLKKARSNSFSCIFFSNSCIFLTRLESALVFFLDKCSWNQLTTNVLTTHHMQIFFSF